MNISDTRNTGDVTATHADRNVPNITETWTSGTLWILATLINRNTDDVSVCHRRRQERSEHHRYLYKHQDTHRSEHSKHLEHYRHLLKGYIWKISGLRAWKVLNITTISEEILKHFGYPRENVRTSTIPAAVLKRTINKFNYVKVFQANFQYFVGTALVILRLKIFW